MAGAQDIHVPALPAPLVAAMSDDRTDEQVVEDHHNSMRELNATRKRLDELVDEMWSHRYTLIQRGVDPELWQHWPTDD